MITVAPFAGAWIEIVYAYPMDKLFIVAPFAGAWIEILLSVFVESSGYGRSLRGSVD